jgi:hypothetical protein
MNNELWGKIGIADKQQDTTSQDVEPKVATCNNMNNIHIKDIH